MIEQKLLYPNYSAVPFMEKKRFAELTGFTEGTIEGWIERLYIPSIKVGKYRAVNLALITKSCLENLPLNEDG
jgi:hypothetical protein